jgi:hypothetical protein
MWSSSIVADRARGNSGLIQREGVIPYTFPREFGTISAMR